MILKEHGLPGGDRSLFARVLRAILLLGIVQAATIHLAEAALPALSVVTLRMESGALVVLATGDLSFHLESSPNLRDWGPFAEGSCRAVDGFQVVLPVAFLKDSYFRCSGTDDSSPPLHRMVQIPAGAYQMGHDSISPPVHAVTLSGFKMDVFEVTGSEWDQVKSWATNSLLGALVYTFSPNPRAFGPDDPVVFLSWFEAIKWANARSEMEGLDPVYYTDASFSEVVRSGVREISNDAVNWAGSGYRLPTEAEWEYAAVSGEGGDLYPWGTASPDISMLNYFFYYGNTTTPVGSFRPNKFGLFDMAGNVREWCWDLHKYDPLVSYTNHIVFSPYDPEPQTDPHGPLAGPRGMSRGGGWVDLFPFVQSVRRHNDERFRETDFTGFRLVKRS